MESTPNMIYGTANVDDVSMPPPRKILRRGTQELEDAMETGHIQLSLPEQEMTLWMNRSISWGPSSPSPTTSKEQNCHRNRNGGAGEGTIDIHEDCTQQGLGRDHNPVPEQSLPAQIARKDDKAPTSVAVQGKKASKGSLFTRFSDIIGHGAVKLRLDEVLLPMALPPSLADSILTGIRSLSASILLFGPPGCGKTQLAKAIAGEAQAAFLSVGPSDILSKFVGESEASIRSVFDKAFDQARLMDSKCAVLFFDEIDALGQSRSRIGASHPEQSGGADPCSRRVLAELLIQLNRINSSNDNKKDNQDPFQSAENGSTSLDTETVDTTYENEPFSDSAEGNTGLRIRVIVVAATNRPEDCDPALVRRFSVRVMVGLPLQRDRKKILNRYLTDIENSISSEQLDDLALATEGWSGSDLESLTREAAMAPVRECIRSAALLKRRTPHREQRGGDSSGQGDDFTGSAIREKARDNLLEQFSTLRTVSMEDFEEAIAFWTGNNCNGDSNTLSDQPDITRRMIHYDSSSDEED